MTNKKLMKKIAPVVMSAAVAMTSMPYACLLYTSPSPRDTR